MVDVIELDVKSQFSVEDAASTMMGKLGRDKLYGIVNNAGILGSKGEGHKGTKFRVFNTNFYGAKRVTDEFAQLLDQEEGRIVNVGAEDGAEYIKTL
jgi:NAD(P)-dependent dehydrogenase (short-subunit alcohol dehydrogenase family)